MLLYKYFEMHRHPPDTRWKIHPLWESSWNCDFDFVKRDLLLPCQIAINRIRRMQTKKID